MQKKEVVCKSNQLIESRCDLTLQESRLIIILCSRLQKTDTQLRRFTFQGRDLAAMMGVNPDSYLRELEPIVDRLQTKLLTIHNGDERIKLTWLGPSKYNKTKGSISLSFYEELEPYLLRLQKAFTQYDLEIALSFSSKYSLKIFELLSENAYLGECEYSITEFRSLLMIDPGEYTLFGNLKARVITPALKEINAKSSLLVSVKYKKEGRAVVGLSFDILEKSKIPEMPKTVDQPGLEELLNLIPDSSRRLKATRNLLNKALKKYDFEYIKETILYTNTREIKKDYLALLGINLTKNHAEAWIERKKAKKQSREKATFDDSQKREKEITEWIELLKNEKLDVLEKMVKDRVKMKMRAEAAAIILAERDAAQSKIEWS